MATLLNFVYLYPEWHCSKCRARKCDKCGTVGFECLVDQEALPGVIESKLAALGEPIPEMLTIVQTFLCRGCRD
jgi:hypothetical protein